jgi:hypothetical protein
MDIKEYEEYLLNMAKNIERVINEAVKETCEEAVRQFQDISPVDTGAFQGGWQASDTEIINDVAYAPIVIDKNNILDQVNIEKILEEKLNEKLKDIE